MGNSYENELECRETETLASLAEDIVFRLPGCTDLMIRKTLESVYRDFCRKTCALVTRRCFEITHGRVGYLVSAVLSDCSIDCVRKVEVDGREVDFPIGNDCTIFVDERFLPLEGETRKMVVETVEMPNVGAEYAPRWFLRKYGDAIVSGVMANLCLMTGRTWSDPQVAAVEAAKYASAMTEARVRSVSGSQMSVGKLNYFKRGCIL